VPGRHGTFLVSPRKVPQRRRPGGHALRFATGSPALLESRGGCGTRVLRPLKQSSPTSPRASAMLGVTNGTNPLIRYHLRLACLGRVGSKLPTKTPAGRGRDVGTTTNRAPVESAEHRRLKRGSRRGLSESQTAGLGRVPQPPFQTRSTGNPQRSEGRERRVAFSLDTFFWRSKRKYLGRGTNSHPKTRASAHKTTPQPIEATAPPLPNPSPARGEGLASATRIPIDSQPGLQPNTRAPCRPMPVNIPLMATSIPATHTPAPTPPPPANHPWRSTPVP
jgi:hypothetical protein